MKQESMQNTDWNDTGNSGLSPVALSRSNSPVPEYPLPCDTEILSCDDYYPQVVARMPKLTCGWLQNSGPQTVLSLSRIFKAQRLLVFGLVAVFVSVGLLGTMFYYSSADDQNQNGVPSVSADQASHEGTSSQESLDSSIPTGQTPVGTGLFASPVISSENEKSVLATMPAENQSPSPWIQSGVATSAIPNAPVLKSPVTAPVTPTGSSASLPVSAPQTPVQASMPSTVPGQPANPGWGDLSANVPENRPVTQYSAGRPAETSGEVGMYPGGNQTMNSVSPAPADIRLVSGQNSSMSNNAYSTHVIDENGQNITSSPVASGPMGSPTIPAAQPYDPNTGMAANPYPQNQSSQPVQEPMRIAANPYASNQSLSPQSSIPAYTPNPMAAGAMEAPSTVPTGAVPGDVIATPMGQFAPADTQSAASATPFVAGENGFRGYSVDSSKQVAPTNYSSNPYLEKTDRIR